VLVDLRSDTVTRPTPAMRRAMAEAEVGDDQYGEDPTVNRLQETFAGLTGKDAALFVPSGTMANQIALRILARPGEAVVAGARQHIVLYEAGAGPANAGVTWRTVADDEGSFDAAEVAAMIAAAAHHQPQVAAITIEDTHMAAGGRCGMRSGWRPLGTWPAGRVFPCTWTAPACGTPPSPAVNRCRRGRPTRRPSPVVSPKAWARRSDRFWPGRRN
jgi:threonine aldolase